MKVLHKFVIVTSFLLCGIFLFQNLVVSKLSLMNNLNALQKPEKSAYELKISLPKTTSGNINIYAPKFKEINEKTAKYYFSVFGLDGAKTSQTEASYIAEDNEKMVDVFKFGNIVHYKNFSNKDEPEVKTEVKTEAEDETEKGVELCVNFIEENLMFLQYEETETIKTEDGLKIKFINRIGNIKNRAFVTEAFVRSEKVVELVYHFLTYEKIGNVKIKSAEEAFLELPENYPPDFKIFIKSVELVYVYDESIVQPSYMFSGITNKGTNFQGFVNAAIYY